MLQINANEAGSQKKARYPLEIVSNAIRKLLILRRSRKPARWRNPGFQSAQTSRREPEV
jgi:hypothetical protein